MHRACASCVQSMLLLQQRGVLVFYCLQNEEYYIWSPLLQFSMVYRTRNVTFEARLFWYMAERTRNITLLHSARFAFQLKLKNELYYIAVRLFRNISVERTGFALWLIERGIVRFCAALVSLFSLQNEEYDTFAQRLFRFLAYRTRKIYTFEARLFWFMAYRTMIVGHYKDLIETGNRASLWQPGQTIHNHTQSFHV